MILSGDQGNSVQEGLSLFVNWHCCAHNSVNYNGDHRNRNQEDQANLHINGKGHDHCTHNNKRGTKEQTQHHVHTSLCLIHIIGDPCHKGRSSKHIQFSVGKPADMEKKLLAKGSAESHGCLCRKILCSQRTCKADHSKQYHDHTLVPDIDIVLILNADIHDSGNNQRHDQLKGGLQHFEQRSQKTFFLIALQKYKQSLHLTSYSPGFVHIIWSLR